MGYFRPDSFNGNESDGKNEKARRLMSNPLWLQNIRAIKEQAERGGQTPLLSQREWDAHYQERTWQLNERISCHTINAPTLRNLQPLVGYGCGRAL
jgi:hypothetical protein